MFVAKVIGKVVSVAKHNAYGSRKLLLVQPVDPHTMEPKGRSTIAVDYVGAGEGDIVIVGAGPGVAREVFKLDCAPIRELVMGIVDRIDLVDGAE
ncbi:TPA: ethanolamine utilization protein EutN [Candidatus Poribacteria bacterium]|nr:ethanolamine utilization protein EutN [Candidatus Poribacteria bacterium]